MSWKAWTGTWFEERDANNGINPRSLEQIVKEDRGGVQVDNDKAKRGKI
jgi:hypothetical protein